MTGCPRSHSDRRSIKVETLLMTILGSFSERHEGKELDVLFYYHD